jgi:hypothetical protein
MVGGTMVAKGVLMNLRRVVPVRALLAVTILAGCGSESSLMSLLVVLAAAATLAFGCKADKPAEHRSEGGADLDCAMEVPRACLDDSTFDQSLPASVNDVSHDAGAGWQRCCLRKQLRWCPPTGQVECNYAVHVLYVCGADTSDARSDTPTDLQAPGRCLTDDDIAMSLPGTADAGGWQLCCLAGQTRLCPPTPTTACNYGASVRYCGDVCSRSDAGICPVIDGGGP